MAGSASPLTRNLIFNLDALASQIFQSVDDGEPRCAVIKFISDRSHMTRIIFILEMLREYLQRQSVK